MHLDWLGETAHLIGIIPLACLLVGKLFGRVWPFTWWAMGCAFGVSYGADSVAHMVDADTVSQIYPVMQAGLALIALRSKAIIPSLIVVAGVAVASVMWRQGSGFDVALRLTAGGMVAGLAWDRAKGWFRAAISTGFGATALCWAAYVAHPGWETWGAYQVMRLSAAILFGVACWRDTPKGLEWQ